MTSMAWVGFAAVEFPLVAVLTAWLVRYYSVKSAPMYALSIVYLSWYVSRV